MKVRLTTVILSSNFQRSSILEEKEIKLIEKVLLPYVRNKKEELDLHSTKK